MQNKIMSCAIGCLLLIVASQCPCVPPFFMTPKGIFVPFCVYIHFVMQIRACHAQSDVCCSSSPLSAHVLHHCLWHQKRALSVFVFIFIPWCKSVMTNQCFIFWWSLASGRQKRQPGPYTHAQSTNDNFMVPIVQVNVFHGPWPKNKS